MFYKNINILNNSLQHHKKTFFLKKTKKTIKLLELFLKLNIIKNFNYLPNSILQIEINTINNFYFLKKIKIHSTDKKTINLSYKHLLFLMKQKNSIYVLKTSYGLLTNHESISKKIGGVLLLELNF